MIGRTLLLGWLCLLSLPSSAQEKLTTNTLSLAEGAKSPAAKIGDVAWLRGHWTGSGLGGTAEEFWSAPQAGMMLSMYRLVRDGKPIFFELVSISEHDGSLMMRLKHFDSDLTGWEEKNERREFRLVSLGQHVARFEGMTYRLVDEGTLTCHVAIAGTDGSVREETFTYHRASEHEDK
ncbi:MAG TPA: DUF6265 family protein [Steroidobacteraceae bacterium]|nr:DUF6265 family protein [Steroidobacteraceae bacterium]